MPSLWHRIAKRHWIDLVVTLVTLLIFQINNKFLYQYIGYVVTNALFGAVCIWCYMRISFFVFKLADRQRREEVAVTLMPANEYLMMQMKLPTCMALLPFLALSQGIMFMESSLNVGVTLVFCYVCLVFIHAFLAGTMHMLRLLCIRVSFGYIVVPLCYIIICVIAYFLALSSAALVFFANGALAFMYFFFCGIMLFYYSLVIMSRNWKRACAAYYTFE